MDNEKLDTSKIVKQTVHEIMSNETTNTPYDFLFRDNISQHPEVNHRLLNLPGKFKNKENTEVFIKKNNNLEMDYAESVLPDGKMIKRESAINVEQETGPIRIEKAMTIFDYQLYTTIALKKPCYPFVVTNHKYKTNFLIYFIEGFVLIIYLIIFDDKKVYKLLNTLNEKDYSKEEFSEEDYVLFTYCLVFAKKPYAQEVLKKLITVFLSIDKITVDYQMDIYASLCMMIKYHFEDEDTIEELLIMITEKMQEEELENLPNYERMKIALAKSEEKYAKREKQIASMASELSKKEEEITKKDVEITKKEEEITKRDKKIANLEALLISNNIIF